MNNFYVAKLLSEKGIYRADTVVYGDVEIRSPQSDKINELEAILKSIEHGKLDIKQEFACRIGTIVSCNSYAEAEGLADERFVGALDLLCSSYLNSLEFAHCGYIKNLDNGEIIPIKKDLFEIGTVFIRAEQFQVFDFNQWILNQKTELSERYKRSMHWTRNARREVNIHSKILFRWFSLEALFKKDERDDITSLIMLFIGFPQSTYSRYVSRELLRDLRQNKAL